MRRLGYHDFVISSFRLNRIEHQTIKCLQIESDEGFAGGIDPGMPVIYIYIRINVYIYVYMYICI